MKLTDGYRECLRKKVQKFYPEKNKLKGIFIENQEKFGNIYHQIKEGDYKTEIINLIKELNNQGLINDFIIIVRKEYPKFAISDEIFELISILGKIGDDNYLGFDNAECLENHLLNLIYDEPYDEQFIGDYCIKDDSIKLDSCIKLKDFFDSKKQIIPNNSSLQEWFKKNFSDEEDEEWVKEIFTHITSSSKYKNQSTLQSYLLIIIYPLRGETKRNKSKKFDIKAELIKHFNKNYHRNYNLRVDLTQDNITEQGYSEIEIPNIIYKFICEARNNDKYLGLNITNNQFCDLRIELFLTKELLDKDFDFKIPGPLKQNKYALCEKNSIVLRSLERLQNKEWRNNWNEKCPKLKEFEGKEIQDFVKTFQQDNDLEELLSTKDKRKQLKYQLSNTIVLRISCRLPTGKKRNQLFEAILEQGIPLCLWIKTKNKLDKQCYQSIVNEFTQLVKEELLQDTDKLLQNIFDIRKRHLAEPNPEKYLGFNLRVLWDDNNRVPYIIDQDKLLTTNT